MIHIETIVQIIVALLVFGLVLGLLWWLVGYFERKANQVQPPLIPVIWFVVVRGVFVVLIVLLLISILLSLIGHPIVRF